MMFAEFTALAQILLLVESAARNDRHVVVELPRMSGSDDKLQRYRLHCLRFLRNCGFTAAVRLPHLPDSRVRFAGPEDGRTEPAAPQPEMESTVRELLAAWNEPETDIRRQHVKRQVLSFRWIAPLSGEDLFHSPDIVNLIRNLRDIGLKERDAQLLTNVILFELVENVAVHADDSSGVAPHALVGALAVDDRLRRVLIRLRLEISDPEAAVPEAARTGFQLIVGDSGRGLVRTLRPHLDEPAPTGPTSTTAAERVTFKAMERWTTSTEAAKRGRGTRGLWRVRQAVRAYGGSLLIHTADAVAGYRLGDDDPIVLLGRPMAPTPGTLVEVHVVAPEVATPAVVAAPAGRRETPIPLRWLTGDHPAPDGLHDEFVLLTRDGGRTHDITHERLVAVLTEAAGLALRNAVTVLVTGVDPITVETAVDALHHIPQGAGSAGPFLLIDSWQSPRWCAADPRLEDELRALTDDGAGARRRATLDRLVRDHPHLVDRPDAGPRLRLDPATVVAQLQQEAARMLRQAVEEAGPGVLSGRFRTPSLQLADRWIQPDELIAGTIGVGVSAFLLARRFRLAMPARLPANARLVQVGPLIRDTAVLLAENLRLREPVYELPDDLPALKLAVPLAPGTPCILCCDVVLSTNRTIKAMRQLIASEALPIAVVTILDARRDRGAITVQGVTLPVIALTEIARHDITPSDARTIDIDPVFRVPQFAEPRPAPVRRWTTEKFLTGCVDLPDVLGLGHVIRPLDRHFSAYFNAGAIVDTQSRMRDEVSAEFLDEITTWIGDAPPDAVRIYHVGATRDYGAKLADLVARRVSDHYGVPGIETREIPRAISGQAYAFPDRLTDAPLDQDVIVIDWGSFDATTVLQMVRLAAEGGARRIIALVLLSQMGRHEERALTMTRMVEAESRTEPVPVEIRFMTSLPFTPMSPGECSLCELIEDLQTNRQRLNLPHEIASHAEALSIPLQPRRRDAVIRSGLDAFGAPISADDAVEYLMFQEQLLAARRNPGFADELARRLAGMNVRADGLRAAAIVRLLAAERRRLAQLPLSLHQCLAAVSRIAYDVARDAQFHERLRLQALVVLAVAGPEKLARNLVPIWLSALGHPVLLHHVMYELWAGLSSPHTYAADALDELRAGLAACAEAETSEDGIPYRRTDMQRLLGRLRERAVAAPDPRRRRTPMEAWEFLRTEYVAELHDHSDAEMAAINLLILLGNQPSGPDLLDDASWNVLISLWHRVGSFVSDRVLAGASGLADLLEGPFARQYFTERHGYDPSSLTSGAAATRLRRTETRLHELRDEKAANTFRENWKEINECVGEFYDVMLRPGSPAAPESVLSAFIRGCPAPPRMIIQNGAAVYGRNHAGGVLVIVDEQLGAGVNVFCHSELLRRTVVHVFDIARHGASENEAARLTVNASPAGRTLRLRFRCAGLPETDPRAAHTERLNELLADFDSRLDYVGGPDSRPEIALTVPLWEPAAATLDGPA